MVILHCGLKGILRQKQLISFGLYAIKQGTTVMWSETVGLRTRPVTDQKKIGLGLPLAGLMFCCETRSCTLVVKVILKDTATFQVL